MGEVVTVPLTEFHNRPGEVLDRSQAGPITLTKRNRPYAVVVSADWFGRAEKALDALRGHRRVVDAHDLSDADREFLIAHGPTADEVETNTWRT